MTPHQYFLAGLIILMMLLGGCSTTLDIDPTTTASPAPGFAPWTAKGKMAVSLEGRAETVSFIWTRMTAEEERVRLSGLFGLGAVEIQRTGRTVHWLDEGIPRPVSELAADNALSALLPTLPYEDLGDWLIGAKMPTDNLWQLEIRRWQSLAGYRIPRQLRLQREEIGLRIAINDWVTP